MPSMNGTAGRRKVWERRGKDGRAGSSVIEDDLARSGIAVSTSQPSLELDVVISSPTNSAHPLPSPSLPATSVPRLKLSLRQSPVPSPSTKSKSKQPKKSSTQSSRAYESKSRKPPAKNKKKKSDIFDDSDSELTPPDDDSDGSSDDILGLQLDDDEEDEVITPRLQKTSYNHITGHGSTRKKGPALPKGRPAATASQANLKKRSSAQATAKGKSPEKNVSVTAVGFNGRDKKRALKNGDKDIRRARDEKFSLGANDAYGGPSARAGPSNYDMDSASSFGDDESEHDDISLSHDGVYNGLGHDTLNGYEEHEDMSTGLLGQHVEDLAYGSGHPDMETERQMIFGDWWESEEEDDSDEEQEEEVFIGHLSGSEIDQQSQSSVQSDSDDSMDSSSSSMTDDEVDEFGFPLPTTTNATPTSEEGPLVLMENWDGQFVLVQPRQERASRRRGSRGSRTAGSVGGSTVLSGMEQNGEGLIIDADAEDGMQSEDSAWWSGSEDECDGDTTDSMAEEDMPMLDSPALDQLISSSMGPADSIPVSMGIAVNGTSHVLHDGASPNPGLVDLIGPMAGEDAINGHIAGMQNGLVEMGITSPTGTTITGPSIIVTDTTQATPVLSTPTVHSPLPPVAKPMPPPSLAPQTPTASGSSSSAPAGPAGPTMGTFHPATDDPAQHAVIDGSGVPTKSPFTHQRRSRRGARAGSMVSTVRSDVPPMSERKRKSSISSSMVGSQAGDLFYSNPTQAQMILPPATLPKRARYSSIPGHPRYIAAQKAQQARELAMLEEDEGEATSEMDTDDEHLQDKLDLEDMLEESILAHVSQNGMEVQVGEDDFRFDRVPVSAYLRRNFGMGTNQAHRHAQPGATPSRASAHRGRNMVEDLGIGVGFGPGMEGFQGQGARHPFSSPTARIGNYEYASFGGVIQESFGLGDTLAAAPGRLTLISPSLHPQLTNDHVLSRKEKRKKRRFAGAISSGNGMGAIGLGPGGGGIPPLQI